MKFVYKALCVLCSFFILTIVTCATKNSVSWYCKRNSTHAQPILGADLKFCEDYEVYWCDKNHKSMQEKDKVIYLTFDAGYENGNVERILNVLKEEQVSGAFFILDNMILKNKNLVERMINEGHIVGNHTLKHKDMTKVNDINSFNKELNDLEKLYNEEFNKEMPKYYRPPEGKFNEQNLKWATELGYKTVMWSFAYADWDNGRQPSAEYAKKKILDNIHNGEVMLLHPTSSTNAKIIKEIIQELKSQGFRFGTLDELCNQ
ncbi:MAG: polysaccharide deacetylase family protein [Clostridia bacterium]|nr:polysaccharide deacetylase family protein [Clostridia bacterium]MBQ7788092.1 polysaccharide deacetylase family protein [Clostridia bacterium]